jgi:hypothetical protein
MDAPPGMVLTRACALSMLACVSASARPTTSTVANDCACTVHAQANKQTNAKGLFAHKFRKIKTVPSCHLVG